MRMQTRITRMPYPTPTTIAAARPARKIPPDCATAVESAPEEIRATHACQLRQGVESSTGWFVPAIVHNTSPTPSPITPYTVVDQKPEERRLRFLISAVTEVVTSWWWCREMGLRVARRLVR